jgi:hypothetical protein
MLLIKKWDETFETADTRKRQRLGWYMNPSGCDSAGYIELMSHGTEGVIAYAVFQAICQWSATQRYEIRGKMARTDGSALNVRQISAFIRMPLDVVQRAICLLTTPEVGWLVEDAENIGVSEICHQSATNLPSPAGDLPLVAGDLPVLCKDKDKEKEKEKEKEKVDAVASRSSKFTKPTVQEIIGYVIEIQAAVDARAFWDYYESNGWRVGRNPMKDWRATVRQWQSRNQRGEGNGSVVASAGNSALAKETRNASVFDRIRMRAAIASGNESGEFASEP